MTYLTKNWDKRNCQTLPSGEIVVREALVDLASQSYTFYAGHTVRNPRTTQVWHYLLVANGSGMQVLILDENWESLFTSQPISNVPQNLDRYGFCVSECGDEVLVTSPHFAPLWGPIGSNLQNATKVASINSANTTAQDVPKGISVAWAGRVVVADGRALWFSDPLAPRTFVAQNAVAFPAGSIYGLHVSAGGALVICSDNGVYALSEQAAASGQIVVGIFQHLSDQNVTNFDSSCASQGRVFALVEKGAQEVDQPNAPLINLDEDIVSRTLVPRLAYSDYRGARIYPTANGFLVSISGHTLVAETGSGFRTWWHGYDSVSGDTKSLKARGVLSDHDGEMILLTEAHPLWRCGERDDLVSATEVTYGAMASVVRAAPTASPVIRSMWLLSDSRFAYTATLQGVTKTGSAPAQVSPVCGVDSWGVGVYKEPPVRNTRVLWSVRTRDLSPEIVFRGFPSRMPEALDVDYHGPGKQRP